ncbi:NADPH--sulfite reductase flavoprotein alpha-component [Flavihumibacter petaseus NBRC 106054]|uniref:assimilatory sulfite reductase (NADPH) n=2 Tax=Flavihumibacter TaxID=1004301 RepID=A0A0E9N228_9BACT|nr:NADPH--sulfite reductase flavoprotein alpha-component [Flavihumibacter petaseus NBRC 106054]
MLPANLFSIAEQEQVQQLIQKFNNQQLQWLAGYLTGLQHSNQQLLQLINRIPVPQESLASEPLPATDPVTVLFGSKSGNSKKIAKNLHDKLIARGFTAVLQDMNQYQGAKLKEEKWLFVVVSTHGEGDPPPAAEDLHSFVHNRKAPLMKETQYAVLALGDRSYASYCKTGKDFDARFNALQATRLIDCMEADVDYEETADAWTEAVLSRLQDKFGAGAPKPAATNGHAAVVNGTVAKPAVAYTRKNPFKATVLEKIQLNGRGSAKETYHVELSLEGSGLSYQPGDTVGIWVENEPTLVNGLLSYRKWDPHTIIIRKDTPVAVGDFLLKNAELTTVSGSFLNAYLPYISDPADAHALKGILTDKQELSAYVFGKDIWDVLQQFPAQISVEDFCQIVLPLQPRLYSIASSFKAHPDEVHLTVGRVQYQHRTRLHRGVASNFVSDFLEVGSEVPVFIETNESFRLPENGSTHVIMVGPGTGIAPFRAFVEERAEEGSGGKNWLFFGDQHFTTDFLYQTEWQRFIKQGNLQKMNTAFSRDTRQKVYVQHRMQQHSSELYRWLEEGAHFYVCGDAKRMAKDVKQSLINIVQQEGGKDEAAAAEYVKQLVKTGRYQEDTY